MINIDDLIAEYDSIIGTTKDKDYKQPELKLDKEEKEGIYCNCPNPKLRDVWLIVSTYKFCTKCRKERK